ncbi:ATP-dependent DNA helicase Q1-like [Engraulis encrasicolus]
MAACVEEHGFSFDSAVSRVLSKLPHIKSLKEEQKTALKEFVGGKDILALLPTGYGKSLIYQIAPLVVQEMGRQQEPIIAVVSPLIALIQDQIREAERLGVSAAQLGGENDSDILNGHFQLVFGSPESWLKEKWLTMLGSTVYRTNLVGIVVDEVHVTYKW